MWPQKIATVRKLSDLFIDLYTEYGYCANCKPTLWIHRSDPPRSFAPLCAKARTHRMCLFRSSLSEVHQGFHRSCIRVYASDDGAAS